MSPTSPVSPSGGVLLYVAQRNDVSSVNISMTLLGVRSVSHDKYAHPHKRYGEPRGGKTHCVSHRPAPTSIAIRLSRLNFLSAHAIALTRGLILLTMLGSAYVWRHRGGSNAHGRDKRVQQNTMGVREKITYPWRRRQQARHPLDHSVVLLSPPSSRWSFCKHRKSQAREAIDRT